jgi:hypothetical protein
LRIVEGYVFYPSTPDKGLKLIGDAAAAEDSGAKYFLAMLKYRCNPTDPEAMALLQEISGGPSPPDGRWKNHNLRRLHYLVKQDLDNIERLYWLDDGDDDDIPLLPIQNAHICIWEARCRRYGPDAKEIIHYCSASVASVMSSTSGRVNSAPPWSTLSAG